MIKQIIDMFSNLTLIEWVGQIIGFFGFVLLIISYQYKKKGYLIISSISIFLFILEEIMASLYTNVITTSVALFRNILMIIYLIKFNKELPKKYIIVLMLLMTTCGILYLFLSNKLNVPIEYMPLITTLIFTVFINNKNYLVVKMAVLFNESMFMVYYYLNNLPLSFVRQLVLSIACLISIMIMCIRKNNRNKINYS